MVWTHLRSTALAATVAFAATTAYAATPAVTTPSFAAAAAATNPFAGFTPAAFSTSATATDSLPDAPSALAADPQIQQPLQGYVQPQDPPVGHPAPLAPLHWKYIPAGYSYRSLTAKDKIYIGARDLYSVGNLGAILVSAGYAHITDGAPNYGVNSEAFGKRVGAAAIRETSQGVFTDIVFAPLFHEDPRFFAEGPNHPLVNRVFHAVTRVFITRDDDGSHGVNYSLLLGYAASTALQSAYYPPINRNFRDAASEYGGSLGGAALGFALDEFADQVLQAIHLEKKP